MSGKDKHIDSHDLSKKDKATEVLTDNQPSRKDYESNSAAEDSASAGNENNVAAEDYNVNSAEKDCRSNEASEGYESNEAAKVETEPSDILSCDLGDVALSEIRPEDMGIRHEEGSGNSSLDQPLVAERKISKCFEAADYFTGQVQGSLSSSSNDKSSEPSADPSVVLEEIPCENGDDVFVELLYNLVIQEKDLVQLFNDLRDNHYTASQCKDASVFSNCKGLFEKDYEIEIVDNFGGWLCENYPVRLIIPTKRKKSKKGSQNQKFNKNEYHDLVKNSVTSRCRDRFVVPVILFANKFICRSATLSVRKAAAYETAKKTEPTGELEVDFNLLQLCSRVARNFASSIGHRVASVGGAAMALADPNYMAKIRDLDRKLLDILKVRYICDLMIEDRKMYRQTIAVSSSEKINKSIYGHLKIEQMPYPGCEFFRSYHEAGREAEGLVFNWARDDCNIGLDLSDDPQESFPDIDWENYKTWDVVKLTKVYLKVLLSRLIKGKGGLLVHCISGWDRTPLFISMLRVSLWADEVVHKSLNMMEMAYLTLGYDWYLFGHNFPARAINKEEILHFCFDFLPHIATDEFSITKMFEKLPFYEKYNRKFPAFKPGRREVLNDFSSLILNIYNEVITKHFGW